MYRHVDAYSGAACVIAVASHVQSERVLLHVSLLLSAIAVAFVLFRGTSYVARVPSSRAY